MDLQNSQFNIKDMEALTAASRDLGGAKAAKMDGGGSAGSSLKTEISSSGDSTLPPRSHVPEHEQFSRSPLAGLASIEKEIERVNRVLGEIGVSLAGLVEQKKKLEEERGELVRIREKWAALDIEIGEVLMRYQKT